jgi:hypothetical protein
MAQSPTAKMARCLLDCIEFSMAQRGLARFAPIASSTNYLTGGNNDGTNRYLSLISGFPGSRQGQLHMVLIISRHRL